MNILFVYSVFMLRKTEKPIVHFGNIQPGISYISSCLKQKGHATELIVLNSARPEIALKNLQKTTLAFKPGLIAFSSVFSEYDFLKNLAQSIKKQDPEIFLLIGGPHVSLNPDGVLDSFDALCIGEGETPTVELVEQLESRKQPEEIRNLWLKCKGQIQKNETRPFLEDLDSLPFPDRSMWAKWISETPMQKLAIVMGRGCPFECTYCCNHALKKITAGKYVRLRSIENIIDEIIVCKETFPDLNEIYLEIETITIDLDWTQKLCEKLADLEQEKHLGIAYGVNYRITPASNALKLFPLFKKANFKYVNIGLESGSKRVRKEILHRSYDNKDVYETVRMARVNGLEVVFYNLIGVPGETRAEFMETVKVNRKCRPDRTWTSIFYPYPGTRLHSVCIEEELIKKDVSGAMERRMSVLDMPFFTKRQIERAYIWFDYLVYKGNIPFFVLLVKCLRKWGNLKYFALIMRLRIPL